MVSGRIVSNCWVAGQWDKLEALRTGRDLYCEFASEFYGFTVTKEDKQRRGVGKQGILMGGYGAGAEQQKETAASGAYGPPVILSDVDALRMRDLYRAGHPAITAKGDGMWSICEKKILPVLYNGEEATWRCYRFKDHKIFLPDDTYLDYTGLRWARNVDIYPDQPEDDRGFGWWTPTKKGLKRTWGSQLTADMIQALARTLIAQALVRVSKYVPIALTVHDDLLAVIPRSWNAPTKPVTQKTAEPGTWLHWFLNELARLPAWADENLPLEAEGFVGRVYEK